MNSLALLKAGDFFPFSFKRNSLNSAESTAVAEAQRLIKGIRAKKGQNGGNFRVVALVFYYSFGITTKTDPLLPLTLVRVWPVSLVIARISFSFSN